eukprot:Ihof_evm3s628 gene=Ihof_evmTU3s628
MSEPDYDAADDAEEDDDVFRKHCITRTWQFKKRGLDPDKLRRIRQETSILLRKERRSQHIFKRRMTLQDTAGVEGESNGATPSTSDSNQP